jgi:hypothetical protein|tara:strand:- start:7698 stop:7889 length:192 start_codon:yes stop_codon:yes gene_type:complete
VGVAPSIDRNLVAEMAIKFPDQAPSLEMEEKEVWFRAGQASVVRWLAQRCDDQEKNVYQMEDI